MPRYYLHFRNGDELTPAQLDAVETLVRRVEEAAFTS